MRALRRLPGGLPTTVLLLAGLFGAQGAIVALAASPAGPVAAPLLALQARAPRRLGGAAIATVLDTHAPMPARKAALQQVRTAAEQGNAFAQLLLGALYFQGPQGARALLPRDPALADVYLSNAATHGNVFAMAAMAELELQQKHVLQANVWAQIYVHYGVSPQDLQGATYAAVLMHRTWPRLPRAEEQTAVDDINAYIRLHNASIVAGQRQSRSAKIARTLDDPACRLVALHPNAHYRLIGPMDYYNTLAQPGIALYWLGVDGHGAVRVAEPFLSLPDWRVQRRMRVIATRWHSEPAPQCSKLLRYALLPVMVRRSLLGQA